MKKQGDVVKYVRNDLDVNALVVISHSLNGEEHLDLTYVDPAKGGTVAVSNVAPIGTGKIGWKEHQATDAQLHKAYAFGHQDGIAAVNKVKQGLDKVGDGIVSAIEKHQEKHILKEAIADEKKQDAEHPPA